MTIDKYAVIPIVAQGSFTAGGTVIHHGGQFDPYHPTPDGQTLHGDHAYAFYQIPENAHKLPLVFLHGADQFSKTWETTPDGREGFQNIFLRKGYSVYLLDQPRRGDAGRAAIPHTIPATPNEQGLFNTFRLGLWPDFYERVSFCQDPDTLDQYFRQNTPNTAPFDLKIVSDGVSAVIDRVGDSVLVSHSQGGGVGWAAAIKNPNIRAIVSFEPGSNFPFPEGELPEPMHTCLPTDVLYPTAVTRENFLALTRIPIVIYYGDNIPSEPTNDPGQDHWRVRVDMARLWVDKINANGGDAQMILLPERGLYGNTHFPFSDTNNVEVAELMEEFLKEKNLC